MSMLKSYLRTASSSWRNQAPAFRVMRLWLGITWIYAGWDKASDSGFLTQGSDTYIGTQLSGFSSQSPLDFAFNKLIEHATFVGGFVILTEFCNRTCHTALGCTAFGCIRWIFDVARFVVSQ